MGWLLKVSHRTAAPPTRLVLHLGPHGRWAEVPPLQLLTEQVQNLVSWALKVQLEAKAVNFFQACVASVFEALLKLQRECLAA